MSDIGMFTNQLYEARVKEMQRFHATQHLRRQARRPTGHDTRRVVAGALHRLAHWVEPSRSLRLPTQRTPA